MADLKLFQIADAVVTELPVSALQVEKSLQSLFEANLEAILGVRFLATEYTTGAVHGGRIDTLGIDENGNPVIIEYKRSISENVINQGLFYLDWLMDHQKEFQWLVMSRLGQEQAEKVEWSAPRLLCIANDFTRYDEHAVKQIARNIELLRYRRFDGGMLAVELVHAATSPRRTLAVSIQPATNSASDQSASDPYLSHRIDYRIGNASKELTEVWDAACTIIQSFGDDIQLNVVKSYYAFKKIKNFVCLEVYPSARTVVAYLKLNPESVALEKGFTRDVRAIGHFGTGDLEVVMRTLEDVRKAEPLFARAYEEG